MYFSSYKFIILFFSIIFENGFCQHYEGSSCTISNSGTNGICKSITSCTLAQQAIQSQGILPTICGFINNEPIVCCPEGLTPASTAGTAHTRKIRATAISQPITQMVTANSIRIDPNVILQVGDKSKQKCEDYGQYVYYEPARIVTTIDAPPPLKVDACAVVEVENIVGGTSAKSREFPHMALVGFDGDDNNIEWACDGSLISEKFVLSAAHCTFHRQYLDAKYILLGVLVLDSIKDDAQHQQMISIKNIFTHPQYISTLRYHDIALFEMEHSATLNPYTRPTCLNTIGSLTNRHAVASGWGAITRNSGALSKDLQKVTLDMFTNTECNYTYRRSNSGSLPNGIEETQLCAGSRNDSKDTCMRNSGGPLQIISNEVYCTYKIIGITSFRKICGEEGVPAVYTRVSDYIKWIEDIVWP